LALYLNGSPSAGCNRKTHGLLRSAKVYPRRSRPLHSDTLGSAAGVSSVAVDNVVAAPVPEPETYVMLLGGLGLIGATLRRRKNL